MNDTPLDLAAQVTLLAWTLQESPNDETAVKAVLQRCLALAGLTDISALKILKARGKSVFGRLPAYPQASSKDMARLLKQIELTLDGMEAIATPQGKPIVRGSDYSSVTTTASTVTLEELSYVAPL